MVTNIGTFFILLLYLNIVNQNFHFHNESGEIDIECKFDEKLIEKIAFDIMASLCIVVVHLKR